jgi:hypothetical protein
VPQHPNNLPAVDRMATTRQRIDANKRSLGVIYLLCALITGFIYFSFVDLSKFTYTTRGSGWAALAMMIPPLVPYLVSFQFARIMVTPSTARTRLLEGVVIAVGVAIAATLLGAFGEPSKGSVLLLFVVQASVYLLAAAALRVDGAQKYR